MEIKLDNYKSDDQCEVSRIDLSERSSIGIGKGAWEIKPRNFYCLQKLLKDKIEGIKIYNLKYHILGSCTNVLFPDYDLQYPIINLENLLCL